MVANIYMPFGIDIEAIEKSTGGRATFTPGEIHCCRVRSEKSDTMVILFFNTGSILLTGFKDEEQLKDVYLESCTIASKHQISERQRRKLIDAFKKKKESTSKEKIDSMNQDLLVLDKMIMKPDPINFDNKKKKKKPKQDSDKWNEYRRILNSDDMEDRIPMGAFGSVFSAGETL